MGPDRVGDMGTLKSAYHDVLRRIAVSLRACIITLNKDGCIVSSDERAALLLGYSPERLVGKRIETIIDPGLSDSGNGLFSLNTFFSDGMRKLTLLHKDGGVIDVSAGYIPFPAGNGASPGTKLSGTLFIIPDDAGLHTVNADILHHKLQSVAEMSQSAIIVIDSDGTISLWNRLAESLFGYSQQEALGQDVWQFLDVPELSDEYKKMLSSILKIGEKAAQGISMEVKAISPRGNQFPAYLSIKTFEGDGGWYTILEIADISAIKIAEERRIDSERLFTAIFDNSPSPVFVKEPHGKYILTNDSLKAKFGEITGKSDEEIFSHQLSEIFRDNEKELLSYAEPMVYENTLPEKDGPHSYMTTMFPLRNSKDEIYAIGGIAVDITYKIKLEQKLRTLSRRIIQAQEDERALVAAELHDELGQQLTALRWSLDHLAETSTTDEDKQKISDCMDMILVAKNQLRSICRGLRPPLFDELGAKAAIDSLVEEYREMHRFEIEYSGAPAEIDSLEKNCTLSIYRVAQEALNNASKHSKAGKVRISFDARSDGLILEISDNGIGFDENDFEEKRGLGIAGMKERASLCGASLDIFSAPGKGATIILKLANDTFMGR